MRKQVIIVGGLALFILLCCILLFSIWFSHRPAYRAESLLLLRPFDNALLQPAFKRQVIRSNPGIAHLGFQISTYTHNSLSGTHHQTNGVMRLVAAGTTAAEAEQIANKATNGLCATLQQLYGIRASLLDQAHIVSSTAVQKPFGLSFGRVRPGPFPTAGLVFFPEAGVSLALGDDWMRHYLVREPGCDLQLMGKGRFNGDFIRAHSLDPAFSNGESAIEHLRHGIAQQEGLIPSSVKEDAFTSQSGLHGTHASFVRHYFVQNRVQGGTMPMSLTTHYYLVTNAHALGVLVEYGTILGGESEQVEEMIRRSLTVY